MGFDDILPTIGNFGRYQMRIYVYISLVNIMCGLNALANVFFQARPKHRYSSDVSKRTLATYPKLGLERCRLPFENANSTYALPDDTLREHYPFNSLTNSYDKCYMYNDNETSVPCTNYIFDDTIYKKSTIMEWKMVCARSYMDVTSDTCFMIGVMIGSIVFGQLSDRFGRKIVLCGVMIAQFVLGIVIALNKYFAAFVVARLLMGASVAGAMLTSYVLGTEMVGPRDRINASLLCHSFFAVGYMMVALFAYYLRHWRYLVLAITAPGIIFFSFWFLVPESARWLLSQEKVFKAEKLIKRMAHVNRKELDPAELSGFLAGSHSDGAATDAALKKSTVFDIFRYPKLRRRSLIMFLSWFTIALSYYGLSWNTSNLGGDDFLNVFIAGSVELPAYFILLVTLNRWGRKTLLCGSMIMGAIFLIAIAIVPHDLEWLIITFAMIGKFAVAGSFSVIYIFTVEQYPTVIRNAGLGLASTIARCGAILAPSINMTSEYWRPAPNLIYGCLVLIAALLSLTLPETLNKKLPETIEEGENF